MSTQFEIVLLRLREMLMRGDFSPGEHLQEIPLARMLEVSRTPVRLALGTLAQEGLLIHKPQRGFLVRQFTVKEIADAVGVRGDLEAMACRLVAERGPSVEQRKALEELAAEMGKVADAPEIEYWHFGTWFDLNGRFHDAIMEASGNVYVSRFVHQLDNVPLAAARAIVASLRNAPHIKQIFKRAQDDHERILDALVKRQSGRAEALMREHVYHGQIGLKTYLENLRRTADPSEVPLVNLVATQDIA